MRKLDCLTLGFFLLSVRAENHVQGYHTEQTKKTTVTNDLLLKKENTTSNGTEAKTRENSRQTTAAAVTAKFPDVVLFDNRLTPPSKRIQITKALVATGSSSGENFLPGEGENSLTSMRDNPSDMRIHSESEIPLSSNNEKIVFSSTRASFESMMNDTSEPEVHLSAHAMKASFWLHTPLINKNQRNTESAALTSADGGSGVPILSPSHFHVIDNLAAPRNGNDDERSQGEDEKGISNQDIREYPLVVFQNDTKEDSVRGNNLTNLCLTCLKDRRVSTEKTAALSPEASPDSDFMTSSPLQPQLNREDQEEIGNKNKSRQSSLEQQVLFFNKAVNHSRSILNNSQIKPFFSDASDTRSLTGMSPVTVRAGSTTTALNQSSQLPHPLRNPLKIGEPEVSIRDPWMYMNKNSRNTSNNLLTHLKNLFVQNQLLNFSSGSVNNTPVGAEAPQSSQESFLPEDSDHSAASHQTARMRLIETHSTPFSFRGLTVPAVKNPESHFLTGRADSSTSVSKSQKTVKPDSHPKEPMSDLLPKASATTFASVTTKTHMTDAQNLQTFMTINSFLKQSDVDPLVKEPQTITTKKVVEPVELFPSDSSKQDSDDNDHLSTLTLTTLSSKSFSDGLTASRHSGTPSRIAQERTFDVSSVQHVAPTHRSTAKHNGGLIKETLILLEEKNQQVSTVVADEDKDIIKMEGKQGEEIKETREKLKLQEEDESMGDEKLENISEELFRSDKTESGKEEEIINTGGEINQNTGNEGGEMEQHEVKANSEEGEVSVGEEDVTLRQEKDDAGGKGVTEVNIVNFTKDLVAKEGGFLTKEAARREETAMKEDIKHNRETGRKEVTNVPTGPTTKSKELTRDKGRAVTNLSCCHSVIKQSGATEPKSIHLDENIAQIVEMKNNPFSYIVTSNHRLVRSTLRSLSSEPSRVTPLLKKPFTQIKSHLSTPKATLTKNGDTSSLREKSTQNKAAELSFSVNAEAKTVPKLSPIFGVSASKLSYTLKPTISPLSSTTTSAHPVLNSITNTLSFFTPRLAVAGEFVRTQPQSTINSSTPAVSIIYRTSDPMNTFSSSVSEANSFLEPTNENKHTEHITPAHMFESSVKDPLTSNMIKKLHISTSVSPSPPQHMSNGSSTRPPTAAALSSETHISIHQLNPHQRQPAPQISLSSSSFDMTSGPPCSFKPSKQTAHSHALHVPADDNKQRSVQTLMASMSPEAKNDQFPLSSMSPLLNLMLFGGDSLPGTYSLTEQTRSASGEEILRANSDAEYANDDHVEFLSGTADEKNQTEEYDSIQTIVTSGRHSKSEAAESGDEKNSSLFIAQTAGRSKHHANNADEFNSVTQPEKLAVKTTSENNHDDPFKVDGDNEANNTVRATLRSNQLSQVQGYTETGTKPTAFAMQSTHKTEKRLSEDFVPITNDFAKALPDTNDGTSTSAFVQSNDRPKTQPVEVTDDAISDQERHKAKISEKHHGPSTPQDTADVETIPPLHNFRNDPTDPSVSAQKISDQIMNIFSEFQIPTPKRNDSVSVAPTATMSGPVESAQAHELVLNSSESKRVVNKESSEATHAEHTVRFDSHTGSLSLRESPTTSTTGERKNTTETQSVEQSEHEISPQAIEQNQHAPPGTITIAPITQPEQGVQASLLKATHRAEGAHDSTTARAESVDYSSFKHVKTALTTKSHFEAKQSLHKRTSAAHTLGRAVKHKKPASPEKTSVRQVILGTVADPVPPTGISPTEIINKTSCGTIGCAKSVESTKTKIGAAEIDHTAAEKMYKTQAGNTERDHFNSVHSPDTKPENTKCSTDCSTTQADNDDYALLSPAASKSELDRATTVAKSMTVETSAKTQKALVETDHLERRGTPEPTRFAAKTTQRHSRGKTSKAREVFTTKVTLSEPEATTAHSAIKSTEQTLLTENISKTQLNRGAAKAETLEARNATRSARAAAKGETTVQQSGRRLLLPETESESELSGRKHRRRTSPHLYLPGITEVSDDLCGSGNYTAEMSLNMEKGVEPGDAVPVLGNLRVVINLKTNNSRINLEVTSCCLSPTTQPDLTNSTCCLFSRLAEEPAGITLLPSAVSTSASFTISLFQMINYSVVYLHCDLSVCLRNRSDCERQCLQQRSACPLEAIVTNLRNRISFGPMLKEVNNATFLEEIDPSELDLVLVIVSLVAGSSLVTVTLLLVWLAYRRRAIWPLHLAAPARACCSCLRQGGDLIVP